MNELFSLGPLWFNSFGALEVSALILAIAAFTFSVFFAHKRLGTESPSRFRVITLLNLSALLALAGIIFKPQTQVQLLDSVQLITPGEIVGELDDSLPTYWLRPTQEEVQKYQLKYEQQLLTVGQLNLRAPNIEALLVFGDGLGANDWAQVRAKHIQFNAPQPKAGFIDTQWQSEINQGEFLSVSSKLLAKSQTKSTLFEVALVDPAGEDVDSAVVRNGEAFVLSSRPKLAGSHLYRLEVRPNERENKKEIVSENINVTVNNSTQLSMMIFESAPSFETKQIQNWAATNGARVLVNTQISRDRFITRAINLEKPTARIFDSASLSQFDLFIADARGLFSLSDDKLEGVRKAVADGMGLLILGDYSLLQADYQTHWISESFPITDIGTKQDNSNLKPIYWMNDNGNMVSVSDLFLPVIQAQFKEQATLSALVFDEKGEPLVASKKYGQGDIATSLVRESFRWVNNEELSLYSHYWQSLIKRLSRMEPKQTVNFLESGNEAYAGGMLRVCMDSKSDANLYWRANKNAELILLQPLARTNLIGCGVVWPQESGWKEITNSSADVNVNESESNQQDAKIESLEKSIYIHSSDSWQAQRQKEKHDATFGRIKQSGYSNNTLKQIFKPISHWLFWWVFIVSAGLIWWERKQFDDKALS